MTRLAGLLCWMIQWCLTDSTLATTAIVIIITAFILSRLDYCNAVLAGLPKVTFVPLQQAQNAVMRLILCLAPHDHVTSALRVIQKWALCKYTYLYLSLFTALCHLHWLPVQYRIFYKLYAPHPYPQGTSQRHCHSVSISQFSWTPDGFDLPAVFATSSHGWDSNLVSAVSHTLHQPPGTLYRHHCNNSLTLTHLNGSWKLFFLNEPFLSLDY